MKDKVNTKKQKYIDLGHKSEGVTPRDGLVYRFFKRFFDILLSLTFLLLFGWLMLILMIIKWIEDIGAKKYRLIIQEDPEGAFVSNTTGKKYNCFLKKTNKKDKDSARNHSPVYSSQRIGKNGKIIKFHKIRSMCPGAEQMKDQLLALGINEANGPVFKLKSDPRITKFGKFLRKTSLDELPQVWDIFVGRISIVGPRPPLPAEVAEYNDYQKHRLDVKGGLLCLWQISRNRHNISFDDWVNLDIKYIETRSLWLDFKIIIKAIWFVLTDHSGE